MATLKSDFETALNYAKIWQEYEGVSEVIANDDTIIVITSCNPAAITAPIPSHFRGYSVSFCQMAATSSI